MLRLIEIYRAYAQIELAQKLQYRFHTLLWLIGLLVEPVVYLVVWSNVAAARGGEIGGFAAADFAAYYIVMMVVRQSTIAPSPFRQARRIREGEMNFMLLRPVHPMHADLAEVNSQKLSSVIILVAIAAAVGWAFGARLQPPIWSALAFLPALFMAGLLRFFFQYTLSAAAFWTDKVDGIWSTYWTLQTFFSGMLAPLPLLPPVLRTIAYVMPFRWIFAFPVDLAMGRLSASEAAVGFAIQMGWTLGSLVLLRVIWHFGIKRYGAWGG